MIVSAPPFRSRSGQAYELYTQRPGHKREGCHLLFCYRSTLFRHVESSLGVDARGAEPLVLARGILAGAGSRSGPQPETLHPIDQVRSPPGNAPRSAMAPRLEPESCPIRSAGPILEPHARIEYARVRIGAVNAYD